jgi:general secretion pathway protein J
MNRGYKLNGFTLLELLIALSIFSFMAVMAYGGVRLVIDGNQQLEKAAENLSSLQRTFMFLQQDLEQAVPRGVRDDYGSKEAAFICCEDDKLLHFSRGGIRGEIRGGSNIRRVEYYLTEGKFGRKIWSTLDRVQDSKASHIQLMEGVQEVDIRILAYGDTEWQDSQPSEEEIDGLLPPRAIKITITTERYGKVSRLFIIGS